MLCSVILCQNLYNSKMKDISAFNAVSSKFLFREEIKNSKLQDWFSISRVSHFQSRPDARRFVWIACFFAKLTLYINRLLFCTHQLILIRRDGGENGLREDKRLVLLLLKVADVQAAVVGVSTANQVYPRLIPVHRVEHDLQQTEIHRSITSVRRLGN